MRVREERTPTVSGSTQNLAKLMATENITVTFEKVSTAAFDLKSRKLILPIWKNISEATYNFLVAHEVSHALNTPVEEWEKAATNKNIAQTINVVEDARIERMILKKYPGCRKDFLLGYKELHNRNFFGLKEKEIDGRELIDRINLHYKSYGNIHVPFAKDEKVWIDRIDNATTFEEVVEISNDLIAHKEEELKNNDSNDSAPNKIDEESDSETENSGSTNGENDSDTEDNDTSESDNDESDSSKEGNDDEENSDENSEDTSIEAGSENEEDSSSGNDSYSIDDEENEEVETSMDSLEKNLNDISATDSNYRNRYSKTIHLTNEAIDNFDLDKLVLPMDEFLMYAGHKEEDFQESYSSNDNITIINTSEAYATIRSENLKVVNNMVKTFEMKKSASLNARTMTAKTGLLDMNKLPFYKLSDDIFLQNEVTPEGKNHAIMMYLDMSSSMNGEGMTSALSQIINMIMFCDKVSIPYRVYGFSDRVFPWAAWSIGKGNYIKDFKRKDWKYGLNLDDRDRHYSDGVSSDKIGFGYADRDTVLVELTRSDAPKADRLKALEYFSSSVVSWRAFKENTYYDKKYAFNFTYGLLGSTPLNISLYLAPKVINQYRKEVAAEKMTFFIYTDGDATDSFYAYDGQYSNRTSYSSSFVDPVNGYYKVSTTGEAYQLYNVLCDRVKFLTDATVIGMRVGSLRDLDWNYRSMMETYKVDSQYFDIRKYLRKNGFFQTEEVLGYDYFTWATNSFMNVSNASIDSELGEPKDSEAEISKRKVASAFARSHKKNHQSRVMVEKIMEVVA